MDGCDLCQRTKPRLNKPTGLLNPLEIPEAEWTDISYDFVVKLPLSNGYDSILTVVDRFTKMAHFIPCNEAISAEQTADLFYREVWKLHGMPLRTISDRGPTFNNHFLCRLYERLNIEPKFSSAYHPQTDGQSERVNQAAEQFLRLYCGFNQNDWADWLPLAEFAWNNAVSSATGMTPFFANQKYHPTFTNHPSKEVRVPAADTHADRMNEVHEEIKSMLVLTQERMKKRANHSRTEEPNYVVGDKVWLSRRNIKTTRPSDKLDYRVLGPYRIAEAISPVAFCLDLPPSMRIHNVFHVSLLSPYHEDEILRQIIEPPPPVETESGEEEYEVESIEWSRIVGKGNKRKLEYLVRYVGRPGEDEWQEDQHVHAPEAIGEFYKRHANAPSREDLERYKPRVTRNRGGSVTGI